jgi:hypothetical protein
MYRPTLYDLQRPMLPERIAPNHQDFTPSVQKYQRWYFLIDSACTFLLACVAGKFPHAAARNARGIGNAPNLGMHENSSFGRVRGHAAFSIGKSQRLEFVGRR